MPRPRANATQQRAARALHDDGFGPTAIWEALGDKFGDDAVSQRTVSTWVGHFKDAALARGRQGAPNLDVRFEWSRLEEYGLLWEAGPYLLQMCAWCREKGPYPGLGTMGFPSFRLARWFWRIHLVAQEQGHDWVWHVARWFMEQEIFGEMFTTPMVLPGLEDYLAYTPWRSEDNAAVYYQAIKAGRIPDLRATAEEYLPISATLEGSSRHVLFSVLGIEDPAP